MIASLLVNHIRENPKYTVKYVLVKVFDTFKHDVSYRKGWIGRKQAFEKVFGNFQKSFSDFRDTWRLFRNLILVQLLSGNLRKN